MQLNACISTVFMVICGLTHRLGQYPIGLLNQITAVLITTLQVRGDRDSGCQTSVILSDQRQTACQVVDKDPGCMATVLICRATACRRSKMWVPALPRKATADTWWTVPMPLLDRPINDHPLVNSGAAGQDSMDSPLRASSVPEVTKARVMMGRRLLR